MAILATRLTNQGTYYVNGSFDEVTQSTISTKSDSVLAAEFNEIAINPISNGLSKREFPNGNLLVANYFDEFTGAPVVNANLIVWLDAAQTSSYSGSGSTWYNLNTTSSNATLYNTPTFSSTDSGGLFNFNKSSYEFAEIPYLGDFTTWTVEAWAKVTSSLTGQVTSVVTGQYDLVNRLNFSIGTNRSPTSYNLCAGFFDGAWHNTTGFSPTLNTWYQLTGTYDGSVVKFYVNSSLNSSLNYTGTSYSGGTIRIARRWDDSSTNSINFFPGDIALVRIYNRALTQDEVTQNFNSARRRFNI